MLRVVATINAVACGLLAFAFVGTGSVGAALFCALAIACCVVELRAGEGSE